MAVEIPKTLSDHPQLVGIVRFPSCEVTTDEVIVPLVIKTTTDNKYMSLRQFVDMATTINGADVESSVINISKNKVTDFYPYTYYVLTDSECEPLIMQPQYLPSSFTIKGKFALSHAPIERYYPSSYKGDTTGNVYNITNTSQMMLPTSTNEGVSYMNANANAIETQRGNKIFQNVISGVGIVASGLMGNFGGALGSTASLTSGIMSLKESDARNKDIEMTPNSITSFGTPSTRKSFNTDKVRLLKYTVNDNIKNKVENFCIRYGNKYNNFGVIDLKTYKGYIKYISPDINSKIDNIYIDKIREIFERGVFIE